MTEQSIDPEEFVGEPPAGDASPDEYISNDQTAGVSEETGTVYAADGEAEQTPHDEELLEEEDEL
ncbi:MAG: hypothetical protein HOQ45_02690 [Nocardioidaceae bacterium]|nr:hypothetical protein [Nocardioidaceae bacterium]